ncbi:hypothetical protein SeLEV6574_g02684 [Synchytrium endobioticum]|nr:hypothetical protein SeLEV6574_g02684 [Synchytrium endobioticum]
MAAQRKTVSTRVAMKPHALLLSILASALVIAAFMWHSDTSPASSILTCATAADADARHTCQPCNHNAAAALASAPGIIDRPSLADESSEEALLRVVSYLLKRTVRCAEKAIVGGWVADNRTWGDPNQPEGAWPVCADTFKNRVGSCLVYSFGINNDFSFDDQVAEKYGCQVHAFDPSMAAPSHQRSPKVMYWNVGVAAETGMNKIGWNVTTVKDVMKTHGHKRIDMLKMDIEGNEWPVLEELVKKSPEVLWASDQLNLEFHFDLEHMVYQTNLIHSILVEFGYHVWNWHVNPLNKAVDMADMKPMALPLLLEISLLRSRN